MDVLEGERQLTQLIPPYVGTQGATVWPEVNGWTTYGDTLSYETYFDMNGFTREHMTCFPTGATIQDPGRYTMSNPAVALEVVDIISTIRLAPASISTWIQTNNALPAMSPTNVDWSQITWGQYRIMLGQATYQGHGTLFLTASGGLFGSGEPNTAERMWVYRFVQMTGANEDDSVTIPASRIILNAVMAIEGDKEFLMRQKRSYELQGAL
jgi:hypothetical protein